MVVNFDLPVKFKSPEPDYEVYLHRIGRAGRFGRKGRFLISKDNSNLFAKSFSEERISPNIL